MKVEQIVFVETDTDNPPFGGILIDDHYVICGDCGGVFDLAEGEVEIIKRFPNWVPISEEIKGDAPMTADKTIYCPTGDEEE